MSRDELYGQLRDLWTEADPVPDGLVQRMRAVVSAEAALDIDLDYELMQLLERSAELAGTRSSGDTSAYTLRFALEGIDLLVRAAGHGGAGGATRLDGWVVPPSPVTVQATEVGGAERSFSTELDANGRFEFTDLPAGLIRLWLIPADGGTPFGTPTFEI